jgi:predicted nucleotide-binding protein (sugar kinase/HSP70/actin superfamily)
MHFNEYHYIRTIAFLQALNKCLPDAILINKCTDIIEEAMQEHKENPLKKELLNMIIETVCKIDYVTNHYKPEIDIALIVVSREDIEISAELLLFLQ